MIYKVKMMSGAEIPLESMDEVAAVVKAANDGAKLIVTKHGIINVASIDSISPFKEKMQEVAELMKYKEPNQKELVEREILGKGIFADFNGQKKLNP